MKRPLVVGEADLNEPSGKMEIELGKASWTGIAVTVLISSVLFYLYITPASAIEYRQYENVRNTELFKQQIHGVGIGYFWANTELAYRKQPLLYCQPNIALNAENYLEILNASIEEKRRAGNDPPSNLPLEAILLIALQESFPCK